MQPTTFSLSMVRLLALPLTLEPTTTFTSRFVRPSVLCGTTWLPGAVHTNPGSFLFSLYNPGGTSVFFSSCRMSLQNYKDVLL